MSTSWASSESWQQLEKMWCAIDWEKAEAKLDRLQVDIAKAAVSGSRSDIAAAQRELVEDLDVRCLAVRHVAKSGSGPGTDGVRWRYEFEMMRAAIALSADDFDPKPRRLVKIRSKNTGKIRSCGLLCYQDRAMDKLWAWALAPVAEARADKKSFAFRKGRSPLDAHQCAAEAFAGKGAPSYAVVVDLKCYYERIQHDWLLRHIPMDRSALAKMLDAGTVYAGKLFGSSGTGISEGSALSLIMGNMVLDGLQGRIYDALNHGGGARDFANGNMVRFADDILIAARTRADAEAALTAVRAFAVERGLALNERKTYVAHVDDGFMFLSKFFKRDPESRSVAVEPSKAAVNRLELELKDLISTWRRGQRELIVRLNRILTGWANYHRFGNSERAFKRIDLSVNAFLVEVLAKRSKDTPLTKLVERYWYRDGKGAPVYAMPNDKTVRVRRLADVTCIKHARLRVASNAFLDADYLEQRASERSAVNMTGFYGAVWERQGGLCHNCGMPILRDEARSVIALDSTAKTSAGNAAYVHERCEHVSVEQYAVSEPAIGRFELASTLANIGQLQLGATKKLPKDWRYEGLLRYFAKCNRKRIRIRIDDIEDMVSASRGLPAAARSQRGWWRAKGKELSPADAWQMAGYEAEPDFESGTVTFTKQPEKAAVEKNRITLPPQLDTIGISDDIVFECEQFFEYLIKKYGL